jgi:hypothetical protein
MPYCISWKPDGIIWTFHHILTNDDVIQANLDIYGDPRFDDLRYQIVDISGVRQFHVTNDIFDEAAAMDEAAALSNPNLVVAVVATGEEAVTVAETYEAAMSSSRWEVRIFNSMEKAVQWVRSSR